MIVISQRACRLGRKSTIAQHPAKDGAPERKTLRVQLARIEIDEAEFNNIFQDPHAWRVLHNMTADGVEPNLTLLRKFELKGLTSEGAHVVLWHSLGAKKIEVAKAKVSKFTLTIADPEASGATTLGVTIEGEPPLNAGLAELLDRVGGGIECEIRADHPNAQEELPLNRHGEGEQSETKKGGRRRRQARAALN